MIDSQRLIDAIKILRNIMYEEKIDPTQGLPEELYIFRTTLMLVSNVDLFITNDSGQELLAWRDVKYYGKDLHIPGGCIGLRERWLDRIQKTVIKELGTEVEVNITPMFVRESMTLQHRPWLENPLERTHNTSILFNCKLPEEYQITNEESEIEREGLLKWFDTVPKNSLSCHRELYGDVLENCFKENRKI